MPHVESKLDQIRKFRIYLLDQIVSLDAEQLNTIPPGFNNNIIWNLGHLIASMQALCYKRAGLPIVISEEFFNRFLPIPDRMVSYH